MGFPPICVVRGFLAMLGCAYVHPFSTISSICLYTFWDLSGDVMVLLERCNTLSFSLNLRNVGVRAPAHYVTLLFTPLQRSCSHRKSWMALKPDLLVF